MSDSRPSIALAMGDPAGISPELTAKLVALDEARRAARIVLIGDRRVYDAGARVARTSAQPDEFIDLEHLDPRAIEQGRASRAGGEFALANYRRALQLVVEGAAQAVCFTPFNKQAMRLADPSYEDEIGFTAGVLGFKGTATEFNILEGLWNARVTSHIPLAKVASSLSVERIVEALGLTAAALAAAGFSPPRIAVAALNPHAGDGGNFGREEIDIIEPAVRAARAQGIPAEGPYPADTVFVRAK